MDGRPREDNYGPLQKHAPQLIAFIMGLVLAIAARIGLTLTDSELSLFSDLLFFIVPLFLTWLAGKLAEGFTYSKRTRDREIAEAARGQRTAP